MATFGYQQDADLPLLTRVYQVDADSTEELTDLLKRWAVKEAGSDYGEQSLRLPPVGDDWRSRLSDACKLTQRIISNIHYDGFVKTSDLQEILESKSASPEELAIVDMVKYGYGDNRNEDEISFWFVGSFTQLTRAAMYGNAVHALYFSIINELYGLVISYFRESHQNYLKYLAECAEKGEQKIQLDLMPFKPFLPECGMCKKPFIPRRNAQEFCSYRCRHAIVMRRDREKKRK